MDIFGRNRERDQGQKGWIQKWSRKIKGQPPQHDGPNSINVSSTTDIDNVVDNTINNNPKTAVVTVIDATVKNAGSPAVDSTIDITAQSASQTPVITSNQDRSTVRQTLWDRAYDSLRQENPTLVENYETLLSKELLDPGMS
jgi:hypothetical protein